jgi:hypothetical protein
MHRLPHHSDLGSGSCKPRKATRPVFASCKVTHPGFHPGTQDTNKEQLHRICQHYHNQRCTTTTTYKQLQHPRKR